MEGGGLMSLLSLIEKFFFDSDGRDVFVELPLG